MVLLLAVILLFIITDSRTIKVIADNTFPSTHYSYEDIGGNFFTGIEVKKLKYNNKKLFDKATLRWNPLTLISNKITLTEVDVKGVELENILKMAGALGSTSSGKKIDLKWSFSLDRIHLDINPYVYENVEFSSFLFETEKVEIDSKLNIDTKALYLYFDSDLVNVELAGKIKKSQLLVDRLNLTEIDSQVIAQFVRILKEKNQNTIGTQKTRKKKVNPFLKTIKIEQIYATLKDVDFKHLSIRNTQLLIDKGEIDPRNFQYKAENLHFTGDTNLGSVDYLGHIEASTIYASGAVSLSPELFEKYNLPLDYENLNYLAGTLRLNHQGVWLDIEHSVQNLLRINNDFNLDITKGIHKIHYDYRDRNLSVDSLLTVNMPYGENIEIENQTLVDREGFTTYRGDIKIPKVTNLPPLISDYFLEGVKGKFFGDKSNFTLDIDSNLLAGSFSTHGYKDGRLELNSHGQNIFLAQVIPNLPDNFKNEFISAQSETYFDFKNSDNSKTNLKIDSNIINLNIDMMLNNPNRIMFTGDIPNYTLLSQIDTKIHLENIKRVQGEVQIDDKFYTIRVDNSNDLELFFNYNGIDNSISNGVLRLGYEEIRFEKSPLGNIGFKTNISNLQTAFLTIQNYYDIKFPNIEGGVNLDIQQDINGLMRISLKSPNIRYLSEKGGELSVMNFYNIDLKFTVDKDLNIELEHYRFNIDNNEYIDEFFSEKRAYLHFENGRLSIESLWVNDQALLSGEYDLETSMGLIGFQANAFSYRNEDFDLLLDLDLKLNIDGSRLNIEGDIDILGNRVYYEMSQADIVEDSDIIIVQEMLQEEESALKDLKLFLKIRTKKPLEYITKDINIEFYNELSVIKNYGTDIMVTGMSTITKGYYQIEDKKFLLDESHLYFVGDPKKPLLDIKANYIKDQYTVHIFISGSAEEPIVNFNSDPYLKQQEILSLILFDGTGSNGQGAEAYTLLGGTFAKGLIKSLGINVDHLLLGTDLDNELSLEIGKKFSDDITLMYMHKNGKPGAKVRIEHTKNFETDIIIMPPNTSSIEFLYKQDR